MVIKQLGSNNFISPLSRPGNFPVLGLGLIILIGGGTAPTALACAVVEPPNGHISVAGEQALILWDATTKKEHFIRRAQFRTRDADFGFLVPTPSKPELAAVDSQVFSQLEDAIKPETIVRPEVRFHWGLLSFLLKKTQLAESIFTNVDSSLPTGSAGGVEVLGQQTVAGYDAAILLATDSKALGDWLAENGYQAPPSLKDWVEPYIAKGWIITALKFSNAGDRSGQNYVGTSAIETKALCMTFETDRPFYPYREPREQGKNASSRRSLQVYYVGNARFSGELQDGKAWVAETKYSDKRTDLGKVLSGLTSLNPPTEGWLTAFEDKAKVRLPSELFFKRALETSRVIPPPIVLYNGIWEIPLCLDVALVLITVRALRRDSLKKSRAPLAAHPAASVRLVGRRNTI